MIFRVKKNLKYSKLAEGSPIFIFQKSLKLAQWLQRKSIPELLKERTYMPDFL